MLKKLILAIAVAGVACRSPAERAVDAASEAAKSWNDLAFANAVDLPVLATSVARDLARLDAVPKEEGERFASSLQADTRLLFVTRGDSIGSSLRWLRMRIGVDTACTPRIVGYAREQDVARVTVLCRSRMLDGDLRIPLLVKRSEGGPWRIVAIDPIEDLRHQYDSLGERLCERLKATVPNRVLAHVHLEGRTFIDTSAGYGGLDGPPRHYESIRTVVRNVGQAPIRDIVVTVLPTSEESTLLSLGRDVHERPPIQPGMADTLRGPSWPIDGPFLTVHHTQGWLGALTTRPVRITSLTLASDSVPILLPIGSCQGFSPLRN